MSQPDCAPRDAIDQIEISSPCTVAWEEMRAAGADGRVRFCGHCRQNVYNVEAMSRAEAQRLIAAREGRLCVRILRRPDGTVVTADCWARLRAARRRGFLPFLGMMVLVGLTELAAIGVGLVRLKGLCGRGAPPSPVALRETRGGIMGALPVRPVPELPPHEMGEPVMGKIVQAPHLMGRMKRH